MLALTYALGAVSGVSDAGHEGNRRVHDVIAAGRSSAEKKSMFLKKDFAMMLTFLFSS